MAVAWQMPEGATLIYRHFGAADKAEIAQGLRQITFARNLQFLIGQDVELAVQVGADGVHFPERDLVGGTELRKCYPDWLLTGAAHCVDAVRLCVESGLDAAIVSPVFVSESKSAGTPIGVAVFTAIARHMDIPVIALGGVSRDTVPTLLKSGASGIAGVSIFIGTNHE